MTAKKFSLVELLITLSIILVLSAMLMPMLNRARETESRSRNRKIDFLQRQYEAVTDRSVHLSGYL